MQKNMWSRGPQTGDFYETAKTQPRKISKDKKAKRYVTKKILVIEEIEKFG